MRTVLTVYGGCTSKRVRVRFAVNGRHSRPRHHGQTHGVSLARGAQVLSLQAPRLMCQAMFRLAVGLQMIGRLPSPAAPYNSEEQRFEQRFMAYFPLSSPQHLDYIQFKEAMDVKGATPAPTDCFPSAVQVSLSYATKTAAPAASACETGQGGRS